MTVTGRWKRKSAPRCKSGLIHTVSCPFDFSDWEISPCKIKQCQTTDLYTRGEYEYTPAHLSTAENWLLIHLTEQKHARFPEPIQQQFMNYDISIEFWNDPVLRKKDFFLKNLLQVDYKGFWETKPALRPLRFSEKKNRSSNLIDPI
jgi:hypothetical protein